MLPACTILIFPPTDVYMLRNIHSVHLSSVYPRSSRPAFHQVCVIPPGNPRSMDGTYQEPPQSMHKPPKLAAFDGTELQLNSELPLDV